MPLYSFINKRTGVLEDLFFSHKEVPSIGQEWKNSLGDVFIRATHVPQASVDTKIDPFSQTQFREKTANKKGTLGNAWDASAEMSAKRADKEGGTDPVREKFFADFTKAKRGTKHPTQLAEGFKKAQEKLNNAFKKLGVEAPKIKTSV